MTPYGFSYPLKYRFSVIGYLRQLENICRGHSFQQTWFLTNSSSYRTNFLDTFIFYYENSHTKMLVSPQTLSWI